MAETIVLSCDRVFPTHLVNAVNLKEGYGMIDIRSPREVLDEEDL